MREREGRGEEGESFTLYSKRSPSEEPWPHPSD